MLRTKFVFLDFSEVSQIASASHFASSDCEQSERTDPTIISHDPYIGVLLPDLRHDLR
jgi:hypothetical protein